LAGAALILLVSGANTTVISNIC